MQAKTYKKNGEEIIFEVSISDIKEICYSSKIETALYFNKIYKNGLLANEYLYGIYNIYDDYKDYLDEDERLTLKLFKEMHGNKFSFIESRGIKLNEDLINAVYNNMNPNYNDLQKIIYIYLKLCLILESDDDYLKSIFTNCSNKFPRTRKRLEIINTDNNKVVCYEFAEIFNHFLKDIDCNVEDIYEYGGCNHVKLNIYFDEYELSFDPINSYIDLVYFKFNDDVNGISIIDGDIKQVKEAVKKVSDDLKQEKIGFYKSNNLFNDDLINKINSFNIDESLKKELIEELISINKLPIKDGDLCNHIINSAAQEFLQKFGTKISITVILTNFIELNISYAISLKDNDNNKIFVLVNQDGSFNILNNNEIINLVKCGKIFWTETNCGLYYIPTIDDEVSNNTEELEEAKKTLINEVKNSNEIGSKKVKKI